MKSVGEASATRPDGSAVVLRVMVPDADVRGVIGYFHGGGWVLGTTADFDCLARTVADRTGCAVVSVEYRLAPEHRYPAAVEDAALALVWLQQHAGGEVPVFLMGESAGGNLAIAAALKHGTDGNAPLGGLILAYPVTDCDFTTPSYTNPDNQLLMGADTMRWFFEQYAPDPFTWTNPDIAVLRAPDVSMLPPSMVILAEHDPLRDEGQAFADRLSEAGVEVRSRVFEGQMHGFMSLINLLPAAFDGIDEIADFVAGRAGGN